MKKALHNRVSKLLSSERFSHVVGVVNMARYLGEKCLPDKICELEYAAYLHDVTKELSYQDNVSLLGEEWDKLTENERVSKQILHSYSAPYYAKEHFSEYATDDVLSAIKNHTVGHPDMSVFDEIIFLADYIEDGRTYKTCTLVRDYVKNAMTEEIDKNVTVLHKACVMAIDYTIEYLHSHKLCVIENTSMARDALIRKIQQN